MRAALLGVGGGSDPEPGVPPVAGDPVVPEEDEDDEDVEGVVELPAVDPADILVRQPCS